MLYTFLYPEQYSEQFVHTVFIDEWDACAANVENCDNIVDVWDDSLSSKAQAPISYFHDIENNGL